MGWPQYTMIVLLTLSLGMQIARHGNPKKGKESFWVSLISTTITFVLLYFGGFFN